MSGKRYPQEFKIQAVKQVVDKGLTMTDVAQRLGVTYKSFTRGFKIRQTQRYARG
jgi:transposase